MGSQMSKSRESRERWANREVLEHEIDDLPMLPSAIISLSQMTGSEPDFLKRVAQIVERDPPLAARLLRESASVEDCDLSGALDVEGLLFSIGRERLAEVLVGGGVVEVFVPGTDGQRNLWTHSIQVAVAASQIAARRPQLGVTPSHAYFAGLLHDIGRFLMFRTGEIELGLVEESGYLVPEDMLKAEFETYGITHTWVGRTLCERWGFPELVSAAVGQHHSALDMKVVSPEVRAILSVVRQADDLSFYLRHPNSFAKGRPAAERLDEVMRRDYWPDPPMDSKALLRCLPEIRLQTRRRTRLALGAFQTEAEAGSRLSSARAL